MTEFATGLDAHCALYAGNDKCGINNSGILNWKSGSVSQADILVREARLFSSCTLVFVTILEPALFFHLESQHFKHFSFL